MIRYLRLSNKVGKISQIAISANRVSVKIFLLTLVFISSVIYILSVNFSSTQGFEIKRLEGELEKNKKDNLELSLSLDRQNSAAAVLEKAGKLKLEKISKTEYLVVSQKNIAVSK